MGGLMILSAHASSHAAVDGPAQPLSSGPCLCRDARLRCISASTKRPSRGHQVRRQRASRQGARLLTEFVDRRSSPWRIVHVDRRQASPPRSRFPSSRTCSIPFGPLYYLFVGMFVDRRRRQCREHDATGSTVSQSCRCIDRRRQALGASSPTSRATYDFCGLFRHSTIVPRRQASSRDLLRRDRGAGWASCGSTRRPP